MKSRILHSSYVIDFLDVNFNSDKLSETLESHTTRILEQINSNNLNDWEIQFKGVYGKGDQIKIFKKTKSLTSDKIKQVVIHIPIPTKQIVSWGVEENQHINIGVHPNADNYMEALPVDFKNFKSLPDYLLDSFTRGIEFSFKDGFKVNGQLIITKPKKI